MSFVSMPIYVSSKAFGRSRVYCKRITFGNVFFLAPLAVDIPPPNQVHCASIRVKIGGFELNAKSNPR